MLQMVLCSFHFSSYKLADSLNPSSSLLYPFLSLVWTFLKAWLSKASLVYADFFCMTIHWFISFTGNLNAHTCGCLSYHVESHHYSCSICRYFLFEILLLWQAWVNAFSRPKAFYICNMFFATVLVSIAHNTYFYILISSSTDDLLDMETNN